MQSFMVDVNAAPMAGADIDDQTVTAGMTVMVQSTITDADTGDMLTWMASSSDDMIATATVDNMGMVTVMGVAAGMATITVKATDQDGAYAEQSFMVDVNAAPMAVGMIDPVMLMEGMSSDAMDLSMYFSDTEGDTLTYTEMSSNEAVASAMIVLNDSDPGAPVHELTITGHMAGEATITVTATDQDGAIRHADHHGDC